MLPVRVSMTKIRAACCAAILMTAATAIRAAEVPQVSADAGPCWAEFTVYDAAKKPLYLTKITTLVRYGFMSKRKTELELSTDVNGQGKFAGLPHEVKKPLQFVFTYKDQTKTLAHDPATNCHAVIDVYVGDK
jgi:hypothetical protein